VNLFTSDMTQLKNFFKQANFNFEVNILSVIACTNLKINSREYLDDVLRKVIGHPASKIDELLPDQWKKMSESDSQ